MAEIVQNKYEDGNSCMEFQICDGFDRRWIRKGKKSQQRMISSQTLTQSLRQFHEKKSVFGVRNKNVTSIP